MKAKPYKRQDDGVTYIPCKPEDATHLEFIMPGPMGRIILPVQTRGTRSGTGNWTWNGDTEKPTLKPSILHRGTFPITDDEIRRLHAGEKLTPRPLICHSWVNDGTAQFLPDCSHELAGATVDLLEIDP